nr:hypothetical protein [Tanacetum cinerariifolium]
HPKNHPTHYTHNLLTRSQHAATRNRGKAIIMALISLSFQKIYKPTNNYLKTSSNTSRANQDNTLRINRGTGYDNQRAVNVVGARENVGDTNITIDLLDMCTNGETVDQDDDDLARERDLLASLINKLKCEIADSKNHNKLLESSNKT